MMGETPHDSRLLGLNWPFVYLTLVQMGLAVSLELI